MSRSLLFAMPRILGSVLLLGLSGCALFHGRPPPPEGQGTPLQLSLPNYPGPGSTDLGALGKVAVVDFWATWCEPCRLASHELQKLYTQHHGEGLEVYGVSLDEDPREIAAFLQSEGITYPILLDPSAQESGPRFQLSVIPALLVVDRSGRIRFAHSGFEEGGAEQLSSEIGQLLAEPPPARR